MPSPLIAAVSTFIAVVGAAAAAAIAQQTIEGTVTSAKLTACDPRPGGCEGHVVLQPKAAGAAPVTIKVIKGTQITEGGAHRFLLATNRREVVITYVEGKGEKVATSIALTPKP